MKKTKKADTHAQAANPTVASVMDAIKSTPFRFPQTRKAFREIMSDLAKHEVKFDEHMKKVEEEIARGCRRTKGDRWRNKKGRNTF